MAKDPAAHNKIDEVKQSHLLANRRTDPDRTVSTAAAGVCFVAVVMALGLARLHTVGGFGVETDFYSSYGVEATNIVSGRALYYPPHNAPGYGFVLAAATFFTGDAFTAGKVLSGLATGLIGWLMYLLLEQLYDARIALATVILLLIALIPFSYLAASDTVGTLSVILALWFFLRRSEHAPSHLFAAGILAGTAYVIRSTSMFLVPGIGVSILLLNWREKLFRRAIAGLAMFLIGASVILLPWLEYQKLKYGSPAGPAAAVSYGAVAAHAYSPADDSDGRNNAKMGLQFRSLSDVVRFNPQLFARRFAYGVLSNWATLTLTVLAFPGYLLVGAGALLLIRRLSPRQSAFFVPLCLGYLVAALVGFTLRYYLFIFPVVFLAVAYFLFNSDVERMLGRVANGRIPLNGLIFAVLVAAQTAHSYRLTRESLAADPIYLVHIAQVLKNRASPHDFVVARRPHLAYLAGLASDSPQAESAEEYLAYARSTHARYIVYSDAEASGWKGLKSLGDPEKLPQAFHLIYRDQPTNTIIYEVTE
ncbi:MAG TPA: glycosyltransferase family 39 protein [Vicinamibacterales bacterium]|nr:glycosyltransferase family 39 protein [Vicinamibacterales bacterium]